MNESKNLACRVRPILEAIITEARNQHDDILTEQSWNPDYTLEISLRVREIRALAQLLKAGGREPATPESTGVKALASASGSVASWNETEPPKDGTIIVAIGRVIWHDDISTTVDSFTGAVMWIKDESGYEGWHFAKDGMVVACGLDDEVKVDYWNLPPNVEAQRQPPTATSERKGNDE